MQPSVSDRVPNLEHLILQKHLLPGPKTLILLAFCRQGLAFADDRGLIRGRQAFGVTSADQGGGKRRADIGVLFTTDVPA